MFVYWGVHELLCLRKECPLLVWLERGADKLALNSGMFLTSGCVYVSEKHLSSEVNQTQKANCQSLGVHFRTILHFS